VVKTARKIPAEQGGRLLYPAVYMVTL